MHNKPILTNITRRKFHLFFRANSTFNRPEKCPLWFLPLLLRPRFDSRNFCHLNVSFFSNESSKSRMMAGNENLQNTIENCSLLMVGAGGIGKN